MSKIFIVRDGNGGRCGCGHRSKKGEVYVLIEGEKGSWTLCRECGVVKNHLKGKAVEVGEISRDCDKMVLEGV